MDKQSLISQLLDSYHDDVVAIGRDVKAAMLVRKKITGKSEVNHSDKPVVVELKEVSKVYTLGKTKVSALIDTSLTIHEGEIVALLGKSGSGKSTLLHMIGGLDKPTNGEVIVDTVNLKTLHDSELSYYRGQKIGFVFQSFYLQPFLNVQDNIEVPAMFARMKSRARHERSLEIAKAVGLEGRIKHYGKELSGGQIQRVAIARALMNRPKILLADEPTGNLDQQTSDTIFELFQKARDDFGATVILVTHDEDLAARTDRIIRVADGRIVE
mgnify:CR=1 FL=1